MRVVITGGCGFLGQRVALQLLARGDVDELVLFDNAAPVLPLPEDKRLSIVTGDIADRQAVRRVISAGTDSVFHLAAVVSGQAEADTDLGYRVNLDGTRAVLDACRMLGTCPRVVFASSLAVFGGPLPDPVPDDAPVAPQSSYGAQKAIGELLVYDMTRKGYIDGRSLRLPTIVVRPGKPNKAASSFASSVIREPLSGIDVLCPVAPATRVWVSSPRATIANLIIGHEVPASRFAHTRSINVPGLQVGMGEAVAALRRIAGDAVGDRVKWQLDPAIDRIVSTWPSRFAAQLGSALGMRADPDFDSIVRAYIADELK